MLLTYVEGTNTDSHLGALDHLPRADSRHLRRPEGQNQRSPGQPTISDVRVAGRRLNFGSPALAALHSPARPIAFTA